ncbi:Gfo/Idh/MocA family oxidoreductase [Pelagicoccus sp. SDUM812003]|uniref:Gfo/Idh/MocA family protein n=1 Tax=Pelagicoccus sp. SDUM812003 TaxID=3041267 RepID=UPI00280C6B27|nr:Gfo/Idh/MocA family oxidoreductase [Pelagicoccus sp. SDUM812003]MDQ8203920.1 Gfo/Idh/MocA family oxidoreductase [Pelagicoccus sp. SDUM812003]
MLRAGIIGTGRIGSSLEKDPLRPPGSSHAGSYALSKEVELVSGCDIDPAALATFGDDWKIESDHLYSNFYDMLRSERLDIVSVCAYATERLEMAQAALEAGAKGLWLEKSLGCSLQEADAIARLLHQRQAVGVVDYPRRGRAPYRKIKSLIDQGDFGRLQSVTCHMTHQLIHTGTHAFDVIRYWCGEALQARGVLENAAGQSKEIVDQGGSGEFAMSSGTQVFVSAYRKKYYIFQFDLIFDDARILIGNDIAKVYRPAPSTNYSGFKELFEQPSFDWGPSYGRDMVGELVHCAKTGEEPLFSMRNATEALRMALALFASAREGGVAIDPRTLEPDFRIENH